MGAEQFVTHARAKTAAEAFKKAKEEAYYEYGHRGYTGTIAEKAGFKMVSLLSGEDPNSAVGRYLDDDTHWCQEKWEDAACIDAGPVKSLAPGEDGMHEFIFFGWASS